MKKELLEKAKELLETNNVLLIECIKNPQVDFYGFIGDNNKKIVFSIDKINYKYNYTIG